MVLNYNIMLGSQFYMCKTQSLMILSDIVVIMLSWPTCTKAMISNKQQYTVTDTLSHLSMPPQPKYTLLQDLCICNLSY